MYDLVRRPKTGFLATRSIYSKTCVERPLSKRPKFGFKTSYRLILVKSIAACPICVTFIKLPFVINIFVLSTFEWPFYPGFPVIFK